MTREERELALYCLKASSDYHSEVCENCINYPNCDHTIQDDVTETIIKALEQEPKTIQEIQAESEKYQKAFEDGYEQGYAQARFDYEQEPILDEIRAEIADLDWHYDNDYFSGNKEAMFKCDEVLQIIDKYRGEEDETDN